MIQGTSNDTSSPVVNITTPINGSIVNTSTVTVNGTATDNVGVKGMKINDNAVATTSGSFSTILYNLASGANTITIVAIDARIDRNEAVQAVMEYFSGTIGKQQALDVVMLYFGG